MTEKVLRCAVYIRVSTTEQMMHGKSLEAQKEFLINYAEEHGMVVSGVYADEGKTARKELKKRKAIKNLLDDVQQNKIDIILFWRIDRWFRNLSDFYKVQDVLDKHSVRWISASEPGINMETRDGRLQLNVVLSIGQNEVDTTSERIKFVNEASIRQGKVIFGNSNMPRGYMVGVVDGVKRMVKNPEEEDMVYAFFNHLRKYQSKNSTLKYMQNKWDKNFSYSMLRSMLESEFYEGTYRGIPYCPAYITKEDRQIIKELTRRNIKTTPSGRTYYFSGLIRCPNCGQLLCGMGCSSIINRRTGEKKTYCYYRCNRALIDKICIYRHRVSQILLEDYLLKNLQSLFADFKIRNSKVKENKKKEKDTRTPDKIKTELKRLNMMFQKERIDWDYYNKEYERLENELKEISVIDTVDTKNYESIENILQQDFNSIYNQLNEQNKQAFWRSIIQQIYIDEEHNIYKVDFL